MESVSEREREREMLQSHIQAVSCNAIILSSITVASCNAITISSITAISTVIFKLYYD